MITDKDLSVSSTLPQVYGQPSPVIIPPIPTMSTICQYKQPRTMLDAKSGVHPTLNSSASESPLQV